MGSIPDEVVIHHSCHCSTATVTPADGEEDEHIFTVDGVDFPWAITERGPVVQRIRDDLYLINVEIMGFTTDGSRRVLLGYDDVLTQYPTVGGEQFPWLLSDDDCVLRFGRKRCPTLTLAFMARNVTGNTPIEDTRPAKEDR